MAIIETTIGNVDEAELEKRSGPIDTPDRFGFFVEYWKDGARVHRSEATMFEKRNPFAGRSPDDAVTTMHGPMLRRDLDETLGAVDNDNEFSPFVEYRLNGELVHRSAHVFLKKFTVTGASAVGGV